jgi:hypothetical protein
MTAEKKVADRVKVKAKELGLRVIRNHKGKGAEVGWPDFFVLGPNRNMLGVETKATGKEATKIQLERAREICAYGFAWCKPDSVADVDFILTNFARHCIGDGIISRDEWNTIQEARKKMN